MDESTVFDPRGRVDAERVELAPRATALQGLRLGILDNTKWNANRLLRKTAALLEAEHGVAAASYYKMESFSKVADPGLVAAIAAGNEPRVCDLRETFLLEVADGGDAVLRFQQSGGLAQQPVGV